MASSWRIAFGVIWVTASALSASALGATPEPIRWDAVAREAPGFRSLLQLSNGDVLTAGTVALSPSGKAIRCYRSQDLGATWMSIGEIAQDVAPKVDLGDGTFLERRSGELLFVYRHNVDYYVDAQLPEQDHVYRIEVAVMNHKTIGFGRDVSASRWNQRHSQLSDAAKGLVEWAPSKWPLARLPCAALSL